MKTQYPLSVGIMSDPVIRFCLDGTFFFNGKPYSGEQQAEVHLGHVRFQGELYPELLFTHDAANLALAKHLALEGAVGHLRAHIRLADNAAPIPTVGATLHYGACHVAVLYLGMPRALCGKTADGAHIVGCHIVIHIGVVDIKVLDDTTL